MDSHTPWREAAQSASGSDASAPSDEGSPRPEPETAVGSAHAVGDDAQPASAVASIPLSPRSGRDSSRGADPGPIPSHPGSPVLSRSNSPLASPRAPHSVGVALDSEPVATALPLIALTPKEPHHAASVASDQSDTDSAPSVLEDELSTETVTRADAQRARWRTRRESKVRDTAESVDCETPRSVQSAESPSFGGRLYMQQIHVR